MILKTLETMGPQHGYGIARRIEQTSGHLLLVNYGTLYPRAAQARTGRLRHVRVGRVRQQSPRQVLPADARRQEAGRRASQGVGTDDGDPRAVSGARKKRSDETLRARRRAALSTIQRTRTDRDLEDELATHLELHFGKQPRRDVARGSAPTGAASRSAGRPHAEGYREQRGIPFIDHLMQDVGFACTLRKQPGLHGGGRPDAGRRHRREHRDFQSRRTR